MHHAIYSSKTNEEGAKVEEFLTKEDAKEIR